MESLSVSVRMNIAISAVFLALLVIVMLLNDVGVFTALLWPLAISFQFMTWFNVGKYKAYREQMDR